MLKVRIFFRNYSEQIFTDQTKIVKTAMMVAKKPMREQKIYFSVRGR